MNKLSSKPYRGTRDFFPEDKLIQNYIFDKWRQLVMSFGYLEYGTPILEPLDIYLAKSGQELASEQTYTFTDRGGRVVAIRPEMTPSVSRLVAERRQELAYPARLFNIASFMRYERTQRGREREFWQLNVDIFGADGATAEAEIISLADKLLKSFGATDEMYVIKINNRQLISFMMSQYLELDSDQSQAMIRLLDHKNKISREQFLDQAAEIFGPDKVDLGQGRLDDLLKAKNIDDLPVEVLASDAIQEIRQLFSLLGSLGVDNIIFDVSLMRGLDYYTGTVFEVFDTDPQNNRSMFGGGRYDGLVGLFGAEPISAVGFAPGYSTTELFLKSHGLLPDIRPKLDIYVINIGEVVPEAMQLADQLRHKGLVVEVDVTERKLDKKIKAASKKGACYALFVGQDEVSSGKYTIKDIISGEKQLLSTKEIARLFKK